MARRLGTSRCSVIRPKEIRRGAKALDVRLVFAGREAAKMRPSEDLYCYAAVMRALRRALVRGASRQSGQGCRRKTAQTSSVAERLTAVQPTGQGVAERADGARQRAPGRSERGVLHLLAGTHYLVPNRWPLQVRKVLLMSACLSHHSASRVVT